MWSVQSNKLLLLKMMMNVLKLYPVGGLTKTYSVILNTEPFQINLVIF